jgi:hypothetical protein
MTTHRAIACALALSLAATTSVWGAEKKKNTAVKKAVGRTETLACRLGTEDRHARIAVVVIKGKTDSFAYYSKWKPRTCSIYLERNRDPYSKWADTGDVTTVSLEKGAFLIEHKPGEYHFIFRNVDRERYCGMDGVINGTLTIKRGKDQCVLGGEIMAEGTPLGHVPAAYANVEGGAPATASAAAEPAKEQAAAEPAKEQAPAGEPATKAAAAEPAPEKAQSAAAEPVQAPPAANVAAEKKAAAAKPASETAQAADAEPVQEQTAASEPGEKKTAAADAAPEKAQPADAEVPKEKAVAAERPQIQAPQAGPADTTTTAAAEPAADAPSGNPLRAFFRALAPNSPAKDTPFPN